MSTAAASSATDVATPESGYGEVLAARDRVTLLRLHLAPPQAEGAQDRVCFVVAEGEHVHYASARADEAQRAFERLSGCSGGEPRSPLGPALPHRCEDYAETQPLQLPRFAGHSYARLLAQPGTLLPQRTPKRESTTD